MNDLRKAMLDDLARSGIDEKLADLHEMKPLTAEQVRALCPKSKLFRKAGAGYLIPYFDVRGDRTGFYRVRLFKDIKVRKKGKVRLVRYLQPLDTPPHVYFPKNCDWLDVVADYEAMTGITEGEKKAIRACKDSLPFLGLGGVYGYQATRRGIRLLKALKMFPIGRRFHMVYDGDVHTNVKVRKAQELCAARLADYRYHVIITDLPADTKLDDFLQAKGVDEFKKLESRTYLIRDRIATLLTQQKGARVEEVYTLVRNIIIQDMVEHGQFLRPPDEKAETDYIQYFDGHKHRLYVLDDPQDMATRAFINSRYGINAAKRNWLPLHADLYTYALDHGTRVQTHLAAYFDTQSFTAYISASDGEMFRVDDKQWERVANGTDGVYLRPQPQAQPIEVYYENKKALSKKGTARCGDAFKRIVDMPNLADESYASTSKELRLCYEVWIWSSIIAALATIQFVLFHGEAGSAKSSSARSLLISMFGSEADVTDMDKNKLDGLDAALAHNLVVCFDNVDTAVPGSEDRFARACTRSTITRRRLYKTFEQQLIKLVAHPMASTRNPKSFTRPDLVERMLYMPCEKILGKAYVPETALKAQASALRPLWWRHVLDTLPKMLRLYKSYGIDRPNEFRMADSANFALAIAPVLLPSLTTPKARATMHDALTHMEDEKTAFEARENPLPDWIETLAREFKRSYEKLPWPDREGRIGATAGELLVRLHEKVPESYRVFPTAESFGKAMQKYLTHIRKRVDVEARYDTHAKQHIYRLTGLVDRAGDDDR